MVHYVKVKGILSSNNGMNLYRGCLHGCIYCDSRSLVYQMNHDFEDVEVKENALVLLENSLMRKRKKCMIGMGAMTDPYIPLEKQLMHTRKSLELIERYGFGATLITKSALALRDIDVLKKINTYSKAVVQMTLTTANEDLCRIIEPHVSTTKERFEALKQLRDEGIPTVVWLSPILPMINDTKENLDAILQMCFEAKVKGIICFSMGVTLREGNREYFYQQLDKYFPGLKERYIRLYGNQYVINSKNNSALMRYFHAQCEKHHVMHDVDAIFTYLNTYEEKQQYEQLSLF